MVDADFVQQKGAARQRCRRGLVARHWNRRSRSARQALERLCREHDVAIVVGTPQDAAPATVASSSSPRTNAFGRRPSSMPPGLYADEVSTMLGARRFHITPCRGEYAELRRRSAAGSTASSIRFQTPGSGLGVHLTRTTWGSVHARTDRQISGFKDDYEGARLPLDAFSSRRARCCRTSPWPTCSRAAPAFARSCTAPTRNSQTS